MRRNWSGIRSHRIQRGMPKWFPGKSILMCRIKNKKSISRVKINARFLLTGNNIPIPKRISAIPLRYIRNKWEGKNLVIIGL